jgi:hypothetical protein
VSNPLPYKCSGVATGVRDSEETIQVMPPQGRLERAESALMDLVTVEDEGLPPEIIHSRSRSALAPTDCLSFVMTPGSWQRRP